MDQQQTRPPRPTAAAAAAGGDAQNQQQQQQQQVVYYLDNHEEEALRLQQEWEACHTDPFKACPHSKYERYNVTVDHMEGDRATQIKLCSFQRPHMRGLHCAWISFFLAFTIWFAPAPLLREIQESLGLSKQDLWTSSIANDCTAIFTRIIMGPICDAYGARIPMAIVLVLGSIPTAMVGLIQDARGLILVRFFIGIVGSSFVMSQFWPSRMFSREIAGTANGLVGGWGNLGGGWAQLMMGALLFPAFTRYYDGDKERSWRTICIIPAVVAFTWGCILPFISDDAPMGNYSEMKKTGTMDRVFMTTSLRSGVTKNTWILFIQYACCFGVELVMNNAAVLYYTSEFGIGTEHASTIGFIYGSMNLFARGLGGAWSDHLNTKMGMRGRLWLQTILLLCEGITIVVFTMTKSLPVAIFIMCVFSCFTQAAEGAIYAVVPHVSKLYTGSVSGFVGSGGNVGSVVYGLIFRSLDYNVAFVVMGCIVIGSSFLTIFIDIPCHAGLLWGSDNLTVVQARERYLERRRREAAYLEQTPAGAGGAAGSSGVPRPQGAGETVATEAHGGAEDHPSEELGGVEGITMTTMPKTTTTTAAIAIAEGGSPNAEDETPKNKGEAKDTEYP